MTVQTLAQTIYSRGSPHVLIDEVAASCYGTTPLGYIYKVDTLPQDRDNKLLLQHVGKDILLLSFAQVVLSEDII